MKKPARSSIVSFLIVAGSASFLVGWSLFRVAGVLYERGFRPSAFVAGRSLDAPTAEVRNLFEAAAADAAHARLPEMATQSCEIQARYAPLFGRVASEEEHFADPLKRADAALAAACAMRDPLSRKTAAATADSSSAAGAAEFQAHLSRSFEALQLVQTPFFGDTGLRAAMFKEIGALRDPLIGLACGLACLLFARRPTTRFAKRTEDSVPPVEAGGAAHSDTALQLLDARGSFFFCEVFDRTPVPLVLLDGEGRIVRLNLDAEGLAGRTTQELRRQFYWDVLIPAGRREWVRHHFPEPEDLGPVEETWLGRDGSDWTMLWSSRFFKSGGSERAALVLLAGMPLQGHATHTRETMDAAKELENELTLINWHCELLLEGPTGPTTAPRDLSHLQERVDRAIQVVRRLFASLTPKAHSRRPDSAKSLK